MYSIQTHNKFSVQKLRKLSNFPTPNEGKLMKFLVQKPQENTNPLKLQYREHRLKTQT